jgi:hypothetical protein
MSHKNVLKVVMTMVSGVSLLVQRFNVQRLNNNSDRADVMSLTEERSQRPACDELPSICSGPELLEP